MILTDAVAGLEQSILQAEADLASLGQQQREKRGELRRYRKALKALTGEPAKRTRKLRADANSGAEMPAQSS